MKELLKLKAEKKRRNPKFVRDESNKRKEVGPSWRKPRGQCNKVRKKIYGQIAMPKVGFRTPAATRGLLASGLDPVRISNVQDAASLEKGKHAAMINAGMGMRKKLAVLDVLEKSGVQIVNCNPTAFRAELKKQVDAKKAAKKAVVKEEPKKKSTKKAPKKESESNEKSDDESQDAQKKELDKILTKKQ